MLNVVIPAGGSGTRLWPLSRAGRPKFLHPLTGTSATLLEATVNRLAPLTTPEQTYVVTGAAHAVEVARQLPFLPGDNIVVEPSAKDSCGALGLAAALIARDDPTALMGAFAADHIVADEARFVACVKAAVSGAREGLLVVIGVTPTRPETGYGYVECGGVVGQGSVHRVTCFKEKPTAEVADEYVRSGRFYWNASMFVWRVDVFLGELRRQQPELHDGLVEIAAAWHTPARDRVLDRVWPGLPRISVDFAVMEGAAAVGLVGAVPADFGWTDVGDFDTLGEALANESECNVVIRGDLPSGAGAGVDEKAPVVLVDSDRLVVLPHSGRLVAAIGLHEMIIVDTPDALLVCPRSRAQDVKHLVSQLKQDGGDRYL